MLCFVLIKTTLIEKFVILNNLRIKSFNLFQFHIFSPCFLLVNFSSQIIEILLILCFHIFLVLNIFQSINVYIDLFQCYLFLGCHMNVSSFKRTHFSQLILVKALTVPFSTIRSTFRLTQFIRDYFCLNWRKKSF